MDQLGFVETVDRLGERVVIAVAHTADGGLDACLGKALSIADAHILRASVAMMHEAAPMDGPPLMQRLQTALYDTPLLFALSEVGFDQSQLIDTALLLLFPLGFVAVFLLVNGRSARALTTIEVRSGAA